MGGGLPPTPPRPTPLLLFSLFAGIEMPSYLNHHLSTPVNPPALFTHDLLVMLGMLVGHAGDVENDAGDVDRPVPISRENAVT